MSFFLKQAINELTNATSDLQTLLDQKANTQVTYSKDDVDGNSQP